MNETKFLKILRLVIKSLWITLTLLFVTLLIYSIDKKNTYSILVLITFSYVTVSYLLVNLLKNT